MHFSSESHVLRPSSANEEKAEKAIKDWREYYVNFALHAFDFNVSTDAVVKTLKAPVNTSSPFNHNDTNLIGGTQPVVVYERRKVDPGPPPTGLWDGAKLRQFGVHGYYCRLVIPNPTFQGGIAAKAGRGHA